MLSPQNTIRHYFVTTLCAAGIVLGAVGLSTPPSAVAQATAHPGASPVLSPGSTPDNSTNDAPVARQDRRPDRERRFQQSGENRSPQESRRAPSLRRSGQPRAIRW